MKWPGHLLLVEALAGTNVFPGNLAVRILSIITRTLHELVLNDSQQYCASCIVLNGHVSTELKSTQY